MAKRLYMTTADYVTIALSPALIMTLIGSLVFFLIEVVYVGQYEARLCYAFALFVFAIVLIARISIEMGSDRAVLFALPLAAAMFAFLVRFVEHPSAFSHLINLALMSLVWWCAHQLTWDSTVIDDDKDASGEGLMHRIGVDGPEKNENGEKSRNNLPVGSNDNELFATSATEQASRWGSWKRLFGSGKGPHTPGLWVLYFSLAALPLFGIGQYLIPSAEVGRRRYAFGLLFVYVASALALLVTTSFLNFRRYLRQRRIEMPLSIAGTWIGVGGVLIVALMLLAMLIPRPNAEVALSRVPWQVGSPGGMSASQASVNRDGGEAQGNQSNPTAGERADETGKGDGPNEGKKDSAKQSSPNGDGKPGERQNSNDAKAPGTDTPSGQAGAKGQSDSESSRSQSNAAKSSGHEHEQSADANQQAASNDHASSQQSAEALNNSENRANGRSQSPNEPTAAPSRSNTHFSRPTIAVQKALSSLGGLAGTLKFLFYIAIGLLLGYGVWKYRQQLLQAIADILRQLRELFGGKSDKRAADEASPENQATPLRFSDFRDPFSGGEQPRMRPEELIRYTFAAFEAWANDRGRPRTPDCTPHEFLDATLESKTPIYDAARRLVRMYGEVAYSSRPVSRESTLELREFWQLMQNEQAAEFAASPR
jgi:hypothetical protein